jgi:6-phosphofructokinase 2
MTEILTITVNPALDLSTEAPAVIPDQKLRCSAPRVQPGGGGVNVSRAIANLGGHSRTLIAYGGHTGAILVDKLEAEGLEPISLDVTYPTRESVTVRDAANGLQYRFMMPGPPWTAEDCTAARQAMAREMRGGDLVVKSGSNPPGMPDDFFMDLNREVTSAGGRLIVDTSGPALVRAGAGGADLFTLRMDLAEARELSGRALVRIEDVAEFARELRRNGAAEIVLVAAGAQGTVIDCAEWTGLTRPPVVVPLSKVGAGDSFVAAFCLALTRGADPVEACAWGTAAAASAVTTADTDLCNREDTERYVKQVTRTPL